MGLSSIKQECKKCSKEYRAAARKYRQRVGFFKWLLGYCPCCGRFFRWPIKTMRRHTQYCDEASNWLTACKDCHYEDDSYFDDLWAQYYSGLL